MALYAAISADSIERKSASNFSKRASYFAMMGAASNPLVSIRSLASEPSEPT
jgi:hypothetical protein